MYLLNQRRVRFRAGMQSRTRVAGDRCFQTLRGNVAFPAGNTTVSSTAACAANVLTNAVIASANGAALIEPILPELVTDGMYSVMSPFDPRIIEMSQHAGSREAVIQYFKKQ